jgi:hypothetical protein
LTIRDPSFALVKRYIIVGKVRPALQDRFGVILDIEFVRQESGCICNSAPFFLHPETDIIPMTASGMLDSTSAAGMEHATAILYEVEYGFVVHQRLGTAG